MGFRHDEQQFRISQVALETLYQTTFINSGDIDHLEKLFGTLHVKVAAPLWFSQKYEAQYYFRKNFSRFQETCSAEGSFFE